MEGEGDSFLKSLQKRQRNLTKKLDRIKKKQSEVKTSGKDIKEEEKKLLESAPQVEELLQETDKLILQYKQHLESSQKTEKKPVKEDDRSKEVASLWVLGEFLTNQQVKEKFVKENPAEVQDLDAFLLLHSASKGQAGKKFIEILNEVEKSVELFLAKSDKIAPGTLRTYKKLSEFAAKAQSWASAVPRPQTPPRVEVTAQPVFNTQNLPEVKPVEEVKFEQKDHVKEVRETLRDTPKPEPVVEVTSKWADDEEDDEWTDSKAEKKEEAKKENDDDGFITVTGRKPKGPKVDAENREKGGERRGRGRRGGRRGGRFRTEGEAPQDETNDHEFRGERRRPRRGRGERGERGERSERGERGERFARPPRENNGDGEVRE